jgi:tRNA nucleotidyltransferase (CCA-adding enzyme)
MVCDMAARLAPGDIAIGFAALTHDLGKALTPAQVLPRHIGHEHAGLAPLRALCERLKVPVELRELAAICCREHINIHRLDELRDDTVHDLIARCDGFRKPLRIDQLAILCEADKRGRLGAQDSAYPQGQMLRTLHRAALAVRAGEVIVANATGAGATGAGATAPVGAEIGVRVRAARIAAIRAARAAIRNGST